jgi:hypothetical protein
MAVPIMPPTSNADALVGVITSDTEADKAATVAANERPSRRALPSLQAAYFIDPSSPMPSQRHHRGLENINSDPHHNTADCRKALISRKIALAASTA